MPIRQVLRCSAALITVSLALSLAGCSAGETSPGPAQAPQSVSTAPFIVSQPNDQTVVMGQTAAFAVSVGGTSPLAYQWRKNSVSIPGATLAAYVTPATTEADQGAAFDVVITNSVSAVTSRTATLALNSPPSIVTQPADQAIKSGQSATFSVAANGTAPISYQWQMNGVDLAGEVSSSYTLSSATRADNNYLFDVTISNVAGVVTSKAVTLSVSLIAPTITWPTPTGIVYGTALSATQLHATASAPGAFVYTPAAGTVLNAGSQALSVNFTPTDINNYTNASATVTVTVSKATPTVAVNGGAFTYDGNPHAATASATGVGGASVAGAVNLNYTPGGIPAPANAGVYGVTASFTSTDANYGDASGNGSITINPATATVTLGNLTQTYDGASKVVTATTVPAGLNVVFGYAGTAGTVYGPSSMPPTNAGNYSVTATVSDPNYQGSATGMFLINQLVPVITWPTPAGIVYGTALSATQLHATASVAGAFVYTPAAGTVLNAGSQALSVNFTPTDINNYTNASATVTVAVGKATPTVTVSGGAFTYDGNPHAATASATGVGGASVAGAFNLNYTPGGIPAPANAGVYGVTASFTSTDANYGNASGNGSITINPATATVTLGNLTQTYDGTSKVVTATTAPAGLNVVFGYAGTAGTVYGPSSIPPTNAGNYSVTATVSDPNYQGSATGMFLINQLVPVVTWPTPTDIVYGTALSATQLNATASVAGAFVYTPAAGAVLDAGSQKLSATFLPTDSTDYGSTSASVLINILALPVILTEPLPQTVNPGQPAVFMVAVTGNVFSYQWRKNGLQILGATLSSYTTPPVTPSDDGTYFDVVVTNAAGSVTSNAARLTVILQSISGTLSPAVAGAGRQLL
jgi:hypothetical protein